MNLLYNVLQALQPRSVPSNPTYIHFFNDEACQNASFVVRTGINASDGGCGELTGDGVNSVNITMLKPGCTVTTYIGPWCSNNQTEILVGTCRSIAAGSYSVDCPDLNGTVNGTYTTISAGSSSTVAVPLPSSTSETPTSFPQQDSTTIAVEIASPSATVTPSQSTSGEVASSTSIASSLAVSSSVPTSFQSPTSTPTSSSVSLTPSSQASTASSESGGNNRIKIIVPSVVLPVFVIFLCVLTYVLWKRWSLKSRKGVVKDGENRTAAVDLTIFSGTGQPSPMQKPANSMYVSTAPASDLESLHSEFSFIPKYPQAKLKNRTAEARSP